MNESLVAGVVFGTALIIISAGVAMWVPVRPCCWECLRIQSWRNWIFFWGLLGLLVETLVLTILPVQEDLISGRDLSDTYEYLLAAFLIALFFFFISLEPVSNSGTDPAGDSKAWGDILRNKLRPRQLAAFFVGVLILSVMNVSSGTTIPVETSDFINLMAENSLVATCLFLTWFFYSDIRSFFEPMVTRRYREMRSDLSLLLSREVDEQALVSPLEARLEDPFKDETWTREGYSEVLQTALTDLDEIRRRRKLANLYIETFQFPAARKLLRQRVSKRGRSTF